MSGLREKMAQFQGDIPLERAHTIPSVWYFDPEIAALESRAVFSRNWQWAARESEIAEPGQFVTLAVAGEPVILIRDKEGVARAFSNVCRHRAAHVVSDKCGTRNFLQCRYHGWTYDLTGRLKGAPEFDGVAGFYKEENSLPAWKVGRWNGHLFVSQASPVSSLADFLSPLPERTVDTGFEGLKFVRRVDYTLECNWKVFVDNYLDGGYHVNTLHPSLAGVINYAEYRTQIARNTVVQLAPLKESKNPDINRVRGGGEAQYWWVYPNMMLNIYGETADLNIVRPLGPERCEVIFEFYFSSERAQDASFVDESLAVAHQVQMEDVGICEEVQRNLKSRVYDTGRYSVKREGGGHHFHQLLARELMGAAGQ